MTLSKAEIEQLKAMFKQVNKGLVKVNLTFGNGAEWDSLLIMKFTDKVTNKYLGSFESPVEIEED